jgi:hypothetical protein
MEPPTLPESEGQKLMWTFSYRDWQIVVEARHEDLGDEFVFFAQWTIINGQVRHFNQSGESYETATLALQAAEERGRRDVDLRLGDLAA